MENLVLRGLNCPQDAYKVVLLPLEDGKQLELRMHPAMYEVLLGVMNAHRTQQQAILQDVAARRN